jgi:nucleotide-binding universal stress UspA family protein
MKNIIVPTDFSKEAGYAVDAAAMLARKLGSTVQLLHIVEAPSAQSFNVTGEIRGPSTIDDVFLIKLIERVKSQLNKIVSAPLFKDVKVSYQVDVGAVVPSIKKAVTKAKADLVIMGTQGVSGWNEVLIGSNTEKVVRMISCPVLTLKGALKPANLKSIAFATDMGPKQAKIVAQVKQFQTALNAKLHIVTINTPANFRSDRLTNPKLESFAKSNNLSNYTLNIHNDAVEGDGIMSFALQKQVGMIAMATHGRTGLAHILSGSIAEEIVNHSKIPVMTFNIK